MRCFGGQGMQAGVNRVLSQELTLLGWARVGATRPLTAALHSGAVCAQTSPPKTRAELLLPPAPLVSQVIQHRWLCSRDGWGRNKGVIPTLEVLQRMETSHIWHLKVPSWSLLSTPSFQPCFIHVSESLWPVALSFLFSRYVDLNC